jgi:hypothetical protein
VKRAADGLARSSGALIVGEWGRGVGAACRGGLELQASDVQLERVALSCADRLASGPDSSGDRFGSVDAARDGVAEVASSVANASREAIASLADGELERARLEPVDAGLTGASVGGRCLRGAQVEHAVGVEERADAGSTKCEPLSDLTASGGPCSANAFSGVRGRGRVEFLAA